jgi:tripeptide aminopeptidase
MGAGIELGRLAAIGELAESRGVRECLQWFTREKQWINEQHLQVCRVPSPTFLEQARAEWLLGQMRAMGWQASLDPAGNVIALAEDDPGQPLIAVAAHLDTVLAPRHKDEIGMEPDGKFHGPGVADNGAGLAALMALAKALKAAPALGGSNAGLVLAATVGEEGEGNLGGMRYLAGQSALAARIRTYLVLDGPGLDRITTQGLASRRLEIVFAGPGGHSWSDYGTANPVYALSHAISTFAELLPPAGNGAPRSAFNIGMIEGGSSVNSIPALARAKVDIRSEGTARIAELAQALGVEVERALERENQRATSGKLTARIRDLGSRPPGQLPENSPLLACLRAVDGHLGIRARLDCASTDANIPLSMGLEAVSIGAGGHGGGAHTPAEWYDPEGRDMGLKRILLVLALLLRLPPQLPI